MIVQAILIAISVAAAVSYSLRYRLMLPGRKRTLIKVTAAGALALASIDDAPITLVFFFMTAGISDAYLSREDDQGFYLAIVTGVLAQVFLCLTLFSAWTGMEAPLIAVLGLSGIWIGFFMMIWDRLARTRFMIIGYSMGVVAVTYMALGTTTHGQLAVVGMFFYLLAQVLMSLEFFVLKSGSLEFRVGAHIIWASYYLSLLMFFVAFTT